MILAAEILLVFAVVLGATWLGTRAWMRRQAIQIRAELIPRVLIAACATLGLVAWLAWAPISWRVVKARIAKEFPNVKSISTAELAKAEPKPVLLDVRTAAEFDVSHLSGARHVDPDAAASKVALPKNAPIVTYCAVGYRSAKFAQRLQEAGFTNVRNLEGSIFQWANEGRPVEPGTKVHPYNKKWGVLLDAERRAE